MQRVLRADFSWKVCLLVVLAFWAPYVIACLPGTNCSDMLTMISTAFGYRPLSNHHPLVMSWLFGGVYWLGAQVGGNQGGHIALLLLQVFSLAAIVTAGSYWLDRLGVPRKVVAGVTLFFCLCPVFPMFAQWLVKNSLSAGFSYLLAIQLVVVLESRRRGIDSPFIRWPALTAVLLACCLSRNDGVFVVVPTVLVALFIVRREQPARKALGVSLAAMLGVYVVWTMLAMSALGVAGSNPREALSLPIQQVARTVKKDPAYFDGTVGERLEALLAEDRSLETLADKYRARKSDPVKKQFRFDSRQEVVEFLDIWAQVGASHPDIYRDAVLAGTKGYWNPFLGKSGYCEVNNISGLTHVCNRGSEYEQHFEGMYNVFPQAKALFHKGINFLFKIPVASWLLTPAFYVWVTLLAGIILCVRRRRVGPVLLVFSVCIIGICLLSPLNGSMRYALPLAFFAPLMVAAGFLPRAKRKGAHSR